MEEDDDSHDIKEILNKAIKEKEADELDKYRSLKIAEMNLNKKMKRNNKDINIKEKDKEKKFNKQEIKYKYMKKEQSIYFFFL